MSLPSRGCSTDWGSTPRSSKKRIRSRDLPRTSLTGSRRPKSRVWRCEVGVTVCWDPDTEQVPARVAAWQSMCAVTAGDKDQWLALFDPGAVVQDPVGVSGFDATGQGRHGRAESGQVGDASKIGRAHV